MGDFSKFLDSLSNFGIEPSLDGIEALCRVLGAPQEALRAIQITGTNGKTSVARMTGALLCAHGIGAGVYTSPHLESYRERFTLNGTEIDTVAFDALGGVVQEAIEEAGGRPITQFEALTGAALQAFVGAALDVAVMEVGMGGRWDATSVVRPRVSVITNVTLDHADWLGPELTDIAAEKSYVMKAGTTGIIGGVGPRVEEVFRARAREVDARLLIIERDFRLERQVGGLEFSTPRGRYPDIKIGPAGQWQETNALLAVTAAEAYLEGPLDVTVVRRTLAGIDSPGRAELFTGRPNVLLDGAHNSAGVKALVGHLRQEYADHEIVLVVSVLKDKAASEMIEELATAGYLVFVTVENDRRLTVSELQGMAEASGIESETAESISAAFEVAGRILSATDREKAGLIVVTGSLSLIGPARALLRRGE